MIIDIVIHPRDLNLLFVAYEGGIIVADLREQKPVRTFELTLSPGAPGGTGYHSKDILLPRRSQVTALAIHPSGHLLAVGYADGTIGFWSLEDEDKPLLLRSIDSPDTEDLSLVDTAVLESVMSAANQHPPEPPREPIFKLAWSGFPNSSDPRGGDTVLTVLGGSTIDATPGVTTLLLHPLQPPAPPTAASPKAQSFTQGLHPDVRAAMCDSLRVKNAHTYNASGPVQDFLLFPRLTPHFSGTYDPSAILLVSDSDAPEARVCEAFDFPPPEFVESGPPETPSELKDDPTQGYPEDGTEPDYGLAKELAKTLQSMSLSDDPWPARLPPYLWSAIGEYLVKVDKHAYETLVRDKHGSIEGEVPFPMRGGMAWSEDADGLMKYTKQQPHRILISRLRDLSIRFSDVSSQLLVSNGQDTPLASSLPSPIPPLTIELAPILIDRSLGLSAATDYDLRSNKDRVDAVYFAPESLECATILRSQAVVLHRLDIPADDTTFTQKILEDEELVSLSHLRVRKGLRYRPVFAVRPDARRGPVTACALSDVGFLAVAYTSGQLLIIDLRGPRVILRSDSHAHGGGSFLQRHAEHEPILSLTWTCCALDTDPEVRIRLIGTAASGQTSIYTLEHKAPSTWIVEHPPAVVEGSARPVSGGSVVLDAKSGARRPANRTGLASVLQKDEAFGADPSPKYIWVCAGAKSVRTLLDVNGERIAKVEWGSKVGTIEHVEVVGRLDSCALVAYTSRGQGLIYSLPHLELIHTLELQTSALTEPPSTDDTGDYITHTAFPVPAGSSFRPLLTTEIRTLFNSRRAAPYELPLVDLTRGRGSVPAQPQPVSLGPPSVMSSVLGYIGSLTVAGAGDQIDALLAGPDRPIPKPHSKLAERPRANSPEAGSTSPAQTSVSAKASEMSSGVGDLYNRLGTALQERGEMLGDLQQSLDSLEQGSKNMVAQAKNLAAQQTAKRWFGF
ncbi:lethal giant larvae like, C-terminal-domain-containing protein [Dichomitus squalens]|nr:lethal giant larvae like, C-terminal-domain-containing protein [Dichomitus squalens]